MRVLTLLLTGAWSTLACVSNLNVPDGCRGSSCDFIATWEPVNNGSAVRFTLRGHTTGWLALGLNPSKPTMAGTDVYEACVDSSGAHVTHRYALGHSTPEKDTNGVAVTNVSGWYKSSITEVAFTRAVKAGTSRDVNLNSKVYIILATGKKNFQKHNFVRVSSAKVDLLNCGAVHVDGGLLPLGARAHGAAMTIAWLFLSPLSILIARYFRSWPRWFTTHWTTQALVVIAVVMSMAAILEAVPFTELEDHQKLGVGCLVLLCLQVFVGLFRNTVSGKPSGTSGSYAPLSVQAGGDTQYVSDHEIDDDDDDDVPMLGTSSTDLEGTDAAGSDASELESNATIVGSPTDQGPRRWMFNWAHRLVGVVLSLLAAFTVNDGVGMIGLKQGHPLVISICATYAVVCVVLQLQGLGSPRTALPKNWSNVLTAVLLGTQFVLTAALVILIMQHTVDTGDDDGD